ncbi:MAG: trypsin-like peptidase domain-containing protein [Flavobacteriales bacterium]|nr:trypsin-like peptidase domain-containing protein [Flavobacteriales bacterium]
MEVEMDWVVMDMYEKELLVYPVMCKSQPFQRYYGGLTESFEDLLTESLLKLLASPELDELQSSMLALQQLESEKLTPISLRSATLQGKAEPANLVHAQATLILGERHGSACFISSDGHLLTTYGLIDTDSTVDIKCSNGALLKARVLRADPISNVALLQADTIGVMHVRPSSNSSYKPGEDVISISSPFDPQLSQSYSKGIISAVRNDDSLKFYQTDVRVSTGANGAPLLDTNGDIIGIINEKFIGTGIEGLSFAVSIHDIFERLKISYQP